jgi:hypothetical protein
VVVIPGLLVTLGLADPDRYGPSNRIDS